MKISNLILLTIVGFACIGMAAAADVVVQGGVKACSNFAAPSGEDCAASRSAYQPDREVLPLDFGLSTLFASDDGSLLGKDWLKALRAYDQRIMQIARGQQRHGRKPRDSARCREAVASLRGLDQDRGRARAERAGRREAAGCTDP